MSTVYQEYEQRELAGVPALQTAYERTRRAALADQVAGLNAAGEQEITLKKAAVARKKSKTAASYTDAYGKNALSAAVNRRALREKLSDRGLSSSGLQAAVDRQTAAGKWEQDMLTTVKRQQALDELSENLTAWLTEKQADIQKEAAKLKATAGKEIAVNEEKLIKEAKSRASTLYKTDQSAESARYKADVQAATNRYNAEVKAETDRYKADTTAENNRYKWDKSAETSRYLAELEAEVNRRRAELQYGGEKR